AQFAAGNSQSHASRTDARARPFEIASRIEAAMRFADQWSCCTRATVHEVHPTTREFRLRPENGHVPPYPAGSHIGVSVLIDGQPARRSYSLVENGDAGTYRIAVRLAPDSRGGSRGMWNLKAGARIEISNP